MYRDTQNMEFHFDIAFDGQIYYNELATSYHLVQRTVDVFVESSMGEISLGVWVRYLNSCGREDGVRQNCLVLNSNGPPCLI